jgi:LPS-assembly protein
MNYKIRLLCMTLLSLVPNMALGAGESLQLSGDQPVHIQANQLYFDRIKDVAYAKGNVEMVQGNQIMISDAATFYRNENIIYLNGNVAIKRDDGSVFFSDEAKLEKNSQVGIALNFKARIGKKTLLASKSAEIINDNIIEMEDAVVSPCKVCKSNYRSFFPLWQFRAKKATLDKEAERIYYKDAKIDVFGVPIFYTPYMSSPSPGAKRKSGFLFPHSQHSSESLGMGLKVPYYWNIAPNKDATITPMLSTKGGDILFSQFRHKLKNGDYELNGSIAHVQKNRKDGTKILNKKTLKGHYDLFGQFSFKNDWHTGNLHFKAKRIFDPNKTYLKKYKISSEQILNTDVSYNVFSNEDYYVTRALSFQDLRENHNNKTTPMALPILEAHVERGAGFWNAKSITDLNFLNLKRLQGESYQRFSFSQGLKVPFKMPYGHLFSSTALVRGDIYYVDKKPIIVTDTVTKLKNNKEGSDGRIYPELRNEWSLPLYNYVGGNMVIIEPVTQLMISPKMKDLDKVGNEDSQLPEISASNLFSPNRFVGFDKIESGTRLNYGIRGNISFEKFKNINAIFGQTYKNYKDEAFDRKSGLDGKRSDYVGKVTVQPDEHVFINDAFRLKAKNAQPMRNEVNVELKYPVWNITLSHFWLNKELIDIKKYKQEIGVSGSYNLYREWWVEGGINSRLGKKINDGQSKITTSSAGLKFQADCLYAGFVVSRNHIKLKDLKPENTYTFVITIPTY